jgi:hypothetical protein
MMVINMYNQKRLWHCMSTKNYVVGTNLQNSWADVACFVNKERTPIKLIYLN